VQKQETHIDMDEINKIFQKIIAKETGHMPRYRYWQVKLKDLEGHVRKSLGFRKRLHKKDNRMFGFTVETCPENGRPRYYAFIYRIKRLRGNEEHLHLVRKVGFARKRKARERAYRWYCERVSQLKARGVEVR